MVGIVLVSHSRRLAEGAVEMVASIAHGAVVRAAGGDPDGGLGTSPDLIAAMAAEVDDGDGVVLVADLGSSVLSARLVCEDLPRVLLADAPFVEGALAAAVAASTGADLAAVTAAAEQARGLRKL